MKNTKKIMPFILLFILIVLLITFCIRINMDELWNYGFSYAIRLGEVPYNDFNMVLTPFYPFLMTIPLLINNSYLSYTIFYSLMVTISFYFIWKMYDKKSYLILLFAMVTYEYLMPSYNSFVVLLMFLLIYLELSKNKNKDILIGLLVMISILTKQSVGVFFIIPTVILRIINKKTKINKRIIGFLIPIIPLLIYLICTNSLYNFIDQCFLGLFDFSGNSANKSIISIIIFILIVLFSIKIIKKNPKDITNYYILGAYSLFVPTFDAHHLILILFLFGVLILNNYDIKGIDIKKTFYICLSLFVLYNAGHFLLNMGEYPNTIKHLEYKFIEKDTLSYTLKISDYVSKNDVIIYDHKAYFYRIANNQKISNLDLVNHGNHGYKSSEKIINELKKNKDKNVMVSKVLKTMIDNNETQIDKKGYEYIIDNYEIVDSYEDFNIYMYKK